MDELLVSSETTRTWLERIQTRVAKKLPSLTYRTSAYWASFWSPKSQRKICYLYPVKSKIRLFTNMPPSMDRNLQRSTASKNWGERFPSTFVIEGEDDLVTAADLVLKAADYDLELFKEALEGRQSTSSGVEPEPPSPEEVFALSLERDLENYLESHLQEIEPGLEPYGEGKSRQVVTEIGRLDLLARDRKGALVIIEVKAGEADRNVLGQILPYMGWVKEHLAKGKPVRGIVVASDFSPDILPAVRNFPIDVRLARYSVRFSFQTVE